MEAPSTKRVRLESIDEARGLIMILMALDHTRDFFGHPSDNPTNLATTTTALFFTRWITHFCAPGFFLLAGTGSWLARRRRSTRELSLFLLTRGLWLIFLEVVVTRGFGWQFNFDYHLTILFILWALGWAMIVLAGLVFLPPSVVAAFGLILIATHNRFDSVEWSNPIWTTLHDPGFLVFNTGPHNSGCLPADTVGRSHRLRIRSRTNLWLARLPPESVATALRNDLHDPVHPAPRA